MNEKESGLSRARLVSEALRLVQEEGLDALSMRRLADRLNVRAASLYWHVRDRRELVELLADSILASVWATHRPSGWRQGVLDASLVLSRRIADQKDADRILLEVPDALERSGTYSDLKLHLQKAGLQPTEAAEVALAVMIQVITARKRPERHARKDSATAVLAVDSGSRGVVVRAGSEMETLFRVAADHGAAPSAVVTGDTVVVRRLRGVGLGEVELNPRHPWRFKIHGGTWNTVLDTGGIDVRDIKVDSGAAKLECFLPAPKGVVVIDVSSGVVGVNLHRPPGAAVVANLSSGVMRAKLDDHAVAVTMSDLHWESPGAAGSADRYELIISSGAVQVSLDQAATALPAPHSEPASPSVREPASALDILLDGVESRVRSPG